MTKTQNNFTRGAEEAAALRELSAAIVDAHNVETYLREFSDALIRDGVTVTVGHGSACIGAKETATLLREEIKANMPLLLARVITTANARVTEARDKLRPFYVEARGRE